MTDADFPAFEKLLKKYEEAQVRDDTRGMLDCANEIHRRLQEYKSGEHKMLAQATAWLRIGDAYLFMGRFDQAIEYFNKIIREIPDDSCKMVAFHRKILTFLHQGNHLAEAENVIRDAYDILARVEKTDSYRNNAGYRNMFLNYRQRIVSAHGSLLYRKKRFHELEKLYLDFFAIFKDENDFWNIIENAELFYYDVSLAYHALKNHEKERYYLDQNLRLSRDEKVFFTDTHLRLAGYAIREKKYKKALEYCDQALSAKVPAMSLKVKKRNDSLLQNAKAKIYELMNKQEEAGKILDQKNFSLNPELKDYLNWLLFDF